MQQNLRGTTHSASLSGANPKAVEGRRCILGESTMRATALVEKERSLVLTWESGRTSEFHYVWLRDNCRCPSCRSPQTFERVSFTGDIPLDIAPREAGLSPAGGLEIVWDNDGMASRYSGDWLHAHRYAPEAPEFESPASEPAPTLWGSDLQGPVPTFDYDDIMGSDEGLLAWIESLEEYGLVRTRGVPTDPRPDLDPPGETSPVRRALRAACGEVERFANHVACVRQDAFDSGTADMKVDSGGYAQALTPIPLPLHTDVPCFDWPPGVLMLHCLQPAASGGENIFVDGFHIAERLRAERPEAFELLSTLSVAFKLASPDAELIARERMLELDGRGRMRVFRFSVHEVQPLDLPGDRVEPFYAAYHALCAMVNDPANQVRFRLGKGDMWASHNHRVAHGRTAFNTGGAPRHLQHAYMNFDDVRSRARVIRRTRAGRSWPDVY